MAVEISLDGEIAVVTGAGGAIGSAVAERLAAAGARVAVSDHNAESSEKVAAALRADGYDAAAFTIDVADRASVQAGVAGVVEVLGRPTILVNNAGTWTIKRFIQRDPEAFEDDIAVCLEGTINMCRAILPMMVEHQRGSIVNVTSEAGRMGQVRMATYSAAKAGVVGFSKAIAREVGRFGVRVNCVSPSITKTGTNADMRAGWREDDVLKDFPLRRFGEPVDQANAVVFLASDLASWITGQVLPVNGGYVI